MSTSTDPQNTIYEPASDHLLRVFGREETTNHVLDLGCGDGRHTEPLGRLGFDLFACDRDIDVARDRLAEIWGREEAERRVTHAKPDALGYPDEFFDWVVAYGAYNCVSNAAELMDALEETRRVLKTGGWIYVAMSEQTVGEEATPETLTLLFNHAGFASAGLAEEDVENGERLLRGIFRRVDPDTHY